MPDNPYYDLVPEGTEGTFVKSSIIPPFGLGGVVYPQDTTAEEHQHCFCFKMSKDAAMRGCETCGKAWIAPRVGHALWGSWQEVGEIEDA